MRLKATELTEHLRRDMAPLYVVHGIEPLAALEAADQLRAAARASGATERCVLTAEAGFDWSSVRATSDSLSLFAQRRLIEIAIPTGKPGLEGGRTLEALAAGASAEDVTLVLLPEIDWQGQQSGWFTALSRMAVIVDAEPLTRAMLPRWIAERLARQKQKVAPDALEWFADQVEGNMLAAMQEVQKLSLLFGEGEITQADLENAVTRVARYESDDLLTAIQQGDASRVARAIMSLEAEAAPIHLLVWQVTNEIREALNVATTGRASRPFPPVRMRPLEGLARRHGKERLARLMLMAHDIDRWVKGVGQNHTAVDMWRGLLELSLRLAGRASVRS
jgi:DNA polymerase III subunit delta